MTERPVTMMKNFTNENTIHMERELSEDIKHYISSQVASDLMNYILNLVTDDYHSLFPSNFKLAGEDRNGYIVTYNNHTRINGLGNNGRESYLYDHADISFYDGRKKAELWVRVNWEYASYPFVYTLDKSKPRDSYAINQVHNQVEQYIGIMERAGGLNY